MTTVPVRHVVLGGLAALLVAAAAFAAQGSWVLPGQDLSAPGQNTDVPQVAVGPDGTAIAVWVRSNGTNTVIQTAARAPGATSFTPLPDLTGPGEDADNPQVAIAPDGTATAVWERGSGINFVIQAAVRAPGAATFTPLPDLSVAGQTALLPQIALAPDGTATVVWQRNNGTHTIIQAAVRAPGAPAFTPLPDLSAPGQNGTTPQVAVAPDGTATAVWQRNNGTDFVVQAAVRAPGAPAFTPLPDLSVVGQNVLDPQLVVAPDGTATAAWSLLSGTTFLLQAAVRSPGAPAFTPLPDLSSSSPNATGQQLAVAPDGTTTVVWTRGQGTNNIIQAAVRAPGASAFTPLPDLTALGRHATNPQVAVAPDGAATAIWRRSNGSHFIVQAALRLPGAPAFTSLPDLSVSGQNAEGFPAVAVAPDGAATAVWRRSNGTNSIVQTAWTANPPSNRAAPQITGTATTGGQLSCDGGSWTHAATVTTVWLRGVTQVGTGPTYTVTPSDTGQPLTCRATATNPYGSASADSTPATNGNISLTRRAAVTGFPIRGLFLTCPATIANATSRTTTWRRGTKVIARTARYRIAAADLGKRLRCTITATGTGGNVTTTSPPRTIPANCQVPRTRGLTLTAARTALGNRGCRVRVVRITSTGVPKGRALGTIPASGSIRPNGATITLQLRK